MTLGDYLETCRARPFSAGQHDCALFAARWLETRTGQDLSLGLQYSSQKEGLRKLKEAGYDSPIAVAKTYLKDVPVAFAQVGDLAVVGKAMGIVAGERIAVLRPEGLGWVPLTDARLAFRVN